MDFMSSCASVWLLSVLLSFPDLSSGCDKTCEKMPTFSKSQLVIPFGGSAEASCSLCQNCSDSAFGLEKTVGSNSINGSVITWTVDNLTVWEVNLLCYYVDGGQNSDGSDHQCCSKLPVLVYKVPQSTSISLVNHTGPMVAGQRYTVLCTVQDVAPVQHLTVKVYRGENILVQHESKNGSIKPQTVSFTHSFSSSSSDDGEQLWCEAELQLGPEGPQRPAVIRSPNITARVHYPPKFRILSGSETITVTEGSPLQLDCSAVGNPAPTVTWTLPSGERRVHEDGVLVLNSTTSEDGGQYTCSVLNALGSVSRLFSVHVDHMMCEKTPTLSKSQLVIPFGGSAEASCSLCPNCSDSVFGLEKTVGSNSINGSVITWTVDNLTVWEVNLFCYYADGGQNPDGSDHMCCSKLTALVYKFPQSTSISLVNHTGPMVEGQRYTVLCTVQDVAPVRHLTVKVYRGENILVQHEPENDNNIKPQTVSFTHSFSSSSSDDGEQLWCEAELQLGPEGPQRPPVIRSPNITARVHYPPKFRILSGSETITVTEGSPLQLDCSAVGNPAPTVTWTLPSGERRVHVDGVLVLNSTTSEDGGQYTCSVLNALGSVSRLFSVHVDRSYSWTRVVIIIAAVVVLVLVLAHCKKQKCAEYNLKDVILFRSLQSAEPSSE
ncbi:uncharacterized protein V6R79_001896 [Siganus canaliculatus]